MANKNNPQDDKLIQDLYAKLNWFTFEATDEEFDPEQVQAIVNLLDTLDPLQEKYVDRDTGEVTEPDKEGAVLASDTAAAFERFKKKYNITEEDLAKKNGKKVPKTVTEEKIVPFPAEFSGELVPDEAEVRKLTEQAASGQDDSLPAVGEQKADNAAEASAAGKESPKRRRFLASVPGKIAVAVVIVLVMGVGLTIGTSAVKQKSFFETVQSGINSIKIIVTGNEMEGESVESTESEIIFYDSWQEILDEKPDILVPEYIPGNLNLNELCKNRMRNYTLYQGVYNDANSENLLTISVEYFENDYANMELLNDEKCELLEVDEENQINYYRQENNYIALWSKGKCIYMIEWSDFEELGKIVDQMK